MKVNRGSGDRQRKIKPGSIRRLRAAGVPWSKVAKKLGVGERTLYREIASATGGK